MKEIKYMLVGEVCSTISDTYRGKADLVTLVNTSDVLEGKVLNHERVQNANLKGQFKKAFRQDDILYSEIRPQNKRYAYVDFSPEDYIASTKLMVIRAKAEVVSPKYLYYFLKNEPTVAELQMLAESRSGTFPQITFTEVANLMIPILSLDIQEVIVKTLQCIEDKIGCNNRINDNLQAQAQALYKAWFVDFAPFDYLKPSDWRQGTVSDLAAEIVCGKTPSTKNKEYYGDDVPFITIPDMHGVVYSLKTERALSLLGAQSQAKKTLPSNSVAVSCIGTAGLVTLIPVPSQTNQQINSIIPKDGVSPFYIYLLMQTMAETINKLGQSGSTIVNLNKTHFGKMSVLIPSISDMKDFDDIVAPIFEVILFNQKENLKLAELRDELLPKLMSGEIDVSAVQL